jgi:hypothetical protein
MNLIKVTCEVRYLEGTKLLAAYEAVYRDMLNKEPQEAKSWIAPGLRIEDRDKKRIMIMDPIRSAIDVEQPPNIGFCKDSILQFFKSVHKRVEIPQVGRYGLRSHWIQDYNGTFEQLLAQFKKCIFANSSLVEKANDLCSILDYVTGSQKLTLTMGPMNNEQLRTQFLSFEATSLPPVFMYFDVDMGDTATKEFSVQYLANFINKAIEEGERLSNEVIEQIGVQQ